MTNLILLILCCVISAYAYNQHKQVSAKAAQVTALTQQIRDIVARTTHSVQVADVRVASLLIEMDALRKRGNRPVVHTDTLIEVDSAAVSTYCDTLAYQSRIQDLQAALVIADTVILIQTASIDSLVAALNSIPPLTTQIDSIVVRIKPKITTYIAIGIVGILTGLALK